MLIINECEHQDMDLSKPCALHRVHVNWMSLEGGAVPFELPFEYFGLWLLTTGEDATRLFTGLNRRPADVVDDYRVGCGSSS